MDDGAYPLYRKSTFENRYAPRTLRVRSSLSSPPSDDFSLRLLFEAGAHLNGLLVDIAGRQRMLIQELCKDALIVALGVLRLKARLFRFSFDRAYKKIMFHLFHGFLCTHVAC